MKGFILNFRNSTYRISMSGGSFGIDVNVTRSTSFFSATGLSMINMKTLEWISSELNIGDELDITISDIENISLSKEEGYEDFMKKCKDKMENVKPDWDSKLEEFRRLEAIILNSDGVNV